MPWRDQLVPVPMARVAVVAPDSRLRSVLLETADAGVFQPDPADGDMSTPQPTPSTEAGRDDPRDAELARVAGTAQHTERCAVLAGWVPRADLEPLRARLTPHGGAVAEVEPRRGLMAPTAHADHRTTRALRPLVSTYATVPYRDIDPTWFAAVAYMVMFGMMFGDVGHGAAIVALGLASLRFDRPPLDRLRAAAPFLLGAGVASVGFGFLYGEAFGPTGIVPTLWLRPLDEPETLLLAGLVGGSCLLAMTFVLSTVNRWREGGPPLALYAASGIGGSLLFAGTAAFIGGLVASSSWLWQIGAAMAGGGAMLTFAGLVVHSGSGPSAIAQAVVEMFDTILRLGSNVVSFTRLAAFGLTHAVITGVVWDGTVDLWDRASALTVIAAGALFVVGNLAAFLLGALVGAIQALRLEYYEMFSRLFIAEGRPFDPWHLPADRSDTP
jgi:V/A-type H+-transporting ATPase subunit I